MQHVEEDPLGPDPQPVDPLAPDCEAALGECEQALQQCQNSDAEENGLQISCKDTDKLKSFLCWRFGVFANMESQGPGEHNSVVTAGGKVFRIFCNQGKPKSNSHF
jgi:hypothetical protein